MTFRQLDSRLQGHPDPAQVPGVEICAGPLGHGVAVGVGMALALKHGRVKPSSQQRALGPGLAGERLCACWATARSTPG